MFGPDLLPLARRAAVQVLSAQGPGRFSNGTLVVYQGTDRFTTAGSLVRGKPWQREGLRVLLSAPLTAQNVMSHAPLIRAMLASAGLTEEGHAVLRVGAVSAKRA